MIKRRKQGVLIAKLSTSNKTAKFKDKCRNIWSIIKQVWYVPFIWSLAWFSYWIFHESMTLGQPLTQGSSFNYVGLAISITAIVVAGYISGKSGKNHVKAKEKVGFEKEGFSTLDTTLSIDDSLQSLSPQNFSQKTEFENPEKGKPQLKSYPEIKTLKIRNHTETPPTSVQTSKTDSNIPSQIIESNRTRKHQEIPAECLICPNLTNCDHRHEMTSESRTPCPYSGINSSKTSSEPQRE